MVDLGLSESHQRVLNLCERIGASISILCSLYLVKTVLSSQYYRCRIYHRIMMGCAVNIILMGIVILWGSAAVPKDFAGHHVVGASGNRTTCTIQGFLDLFLQFAVPFYYVALSLLSLLAMHTKFEIKRYLWIEKWIHAAVYVLPLSSASYLLTLDAFNPGIRTCHFISLPVGCGDESDYTLVCTRGPQNISHLQNYFFVIPYLFIFIFPACVMAVVYIRVRFCQGIKGRIVANSVAKQSCLYLFALYWIYVFKIVDESLINRAGTYIFFTNVLSNTSQALVGLWTLLVYWYFRSDDPTQVAPATGLPDSTADSPKGSDDALHAHVGDKSQGASSRSSKTDGSSRRRGRRSSGREEVSGYFQKPEFSIFDGTDVGNMSNSPWAEYLVDVYEDDDYGATNGGEYDDTSRNFCLAEGTPAPAVTTKNDIPS